MVEDEEENLLTVDELFPLSKEESNLVRIILLAKRIAPKAVRTYFNQRFEPTQLKKIIHNNHSILYNLRLKRILTLDQWNLLFSSAGVPNSESFDITLMLCLLRHVMDVVEPRTGWDNKPPEYDTGVGADLTRIRHFRNMIAHSESREIDDTDFSSVWKELSNAIGRLGGALLKKECDILKIQPLENKEHWNTKDLMRKVLEIWKLSNQNFIKTVADEYFIEKFHERSCLIIGNNGVGKTANLQHMSQVLHDNGYHVIPVTTCEETILYYNPYFSTVFEIDDFCGTCSLEHPNAPVDFETNVVDEEESVSTIAHFNRRYESENVFEASDNLCATNSEIYFMLVFVIIQSVIHMPYILVFTDYIEANFCVT